MRAQLDAARDTPPAGAEKYAGGTAVFGLQIVWSKHGLSTNTETIRLTWNNIFYELGPMLLEEASEQQMRQRLSNEIWAYRKGNERKPDRVRVEDDSFETIKVQLLALGLTRRSQRKHAASDTNTYWSLTPYGETALMKLRAIGKIAVK